MRRTVSPTPAAPPSAPGLSGCLTYANGAMGNGGFSVFSPGVFDYIAGNQTLWERNPLDRLVEEGSSLHAIATVFGNPWILYATRFISRNMASGQGVVEGLVVNREFREG